MSYVVESTKVFWTYGHTYIRMDGRYYQVPTSVHWGAMKPVLYLRESGLISLVSLNCRFLNIGKI